MEKLSFTSDYMEGAHPRILERLMETNLLKTPGYGTDEYCESARKKYDWHVVLRRRKCTFYPEAPRPMR